MFVFSRKKQHTKSTQQGFSLIELMVTITLVTLITGLLMAKYSSFNDVVLLKNQAYEIALDIREAQIFGVSARGENGTFKEAYGIYIEKDSPNYFLFQDTNNNLKYDPGEEIGQAYTIDSRFEIFQICDDNNCNRSKTSVAFKRPDFDAYIRLANGSGNLSNSDEGYIEIKMRSKNSNGFSKKIVVYQSGQISVQTN